MRLKMKNRSHRYVITRPRPRHGHKYTICKMCLSLMMATCIKSALSGLRQFLVTESPLKMIKNAFYFNSKALFVLKIFKVFS